MRAPGRTAFLAACFWLVAAQAAESPQDVRRIISEVNPQCWLESGTTAKSAVVYPKDARSREEQGAVVLEVTVREKWGRPKSAKVVGTTGFPRLDKEALRSTKATRFRSNCPGTPFRYKIVFRIEYD